MHLRNIILQLSLFDVMLCSQNEDLYTACGKGYVAEVKRLLSLRADCNYRKEDTVSCVLLWCSNKCVIHTTLSVQLCTVWY